MDGQRCLRIGRAGVWAATALVAAVVLAATVNPRPGGAQSAIPPYVAAAIANPARPEADRNVDKDRLPGELIAFAGLKPGDRILELAPGGGYFTRLFGNIVGPSGQVYELVSEEELKRSQRPAEIVKAIADNPAFPRITVLIQPMLGMKPPEPVDMVWTTQNYHDFRNAQGDMSAFNKAVFGVLKPGGVFFVTDHAAAPGSGARDTSTLHRIDAELVKAEVLAAGFVLEAESPILRNPADPHALHSSNAELRGHTDKFTFRFRKPPAAR